MKRLLVILALSLAACPPPAPPVPPPSTGCAAACEHMRALECELGKPTPRGASCEQVCEATQANGVNFNTGCVAAAATCAAAEEC